MVFIELSHKNEKEINPIKTTVKLSSFRDKIKFIYVLK
ncbi:MAG: hypothetical protein ACJAWH_001494 [Maribacter sp.]|jgi:hypothetical protein